MPSNTLRPALLERAEREGKEAEVEDQLFRLSRILDAQPRLGILLGRLCRVRAEGSVRLMRKVLEGAGTVDRQRLNGCRRRRACETSRTKRP